MIGELIRIMMNTAQRISLSGKGVANWNERPESKKKQMIGGGWCDQGWTEKMIRDIYMK